MADPIAEKPKLQLRSGVQVTADKTPSPATKLLINHGKPNFTLPRTTKQNGDTSPVSNGNSTINLNKNDNYNPYKSASSFSNPTVNNNNIILNSTKFNGVFKPSKVSASEEDPNENEASKVVLRRTTIGDPDIKEEENDDVPEFIRRQRRIQERLAKDNVLDFENRRSGYFTHTIITPTSPNRTSFVETMSSPAIVPALEIPPPTVTQSQKHDHTVQSTLVEEQKEGEEKVSDTSNAALVSNGNTNGHMEEEVARAIEEVNKAVAGEDDDKAAVVEDGPHVEPEVLRTAIEEPKNPAEQMSIMPVYEQEQTIVDSNLEIVVENVPQPLDTGAPKREETVVGVVKQSESHEIEVTKSADTAEPIATETQNLQPVTAETVVQVARNDDVQVANSDAANEEIVPTNGHSVTAEVHAEHSEPLIELKDPKQSGPAEISTATLQQNGHSVDNQCNPSNGPTIPNTDPSEALGVNFEPKECESVVKVAALEELKNVKLDTKADDKEAQVTSVPKSQ